MKTLIVIALVALVGYLGWSRLDLPSRGGPDSLGRSPHVIVYGRERCGITQRTRSELQRAGVPFEYKSVDHPGVGDELHPRMEAAGLDTRRYGLPVVEVNGEMLIRPKPAAIAEKYRRAVQRRGGPGADRASAEARGLAAAQGLADPLVKCRIDGRETYTLRSQCPH
jgi:hypothetical protein